MSIFFLLFFLTLLKCHSDNAFVPMRRIRSAVQKWTPNSGELQCKAPQPTQRQHSNVNNNRQLYVVKYTSVKCF